MPFIVKTPPKTEQELFDEGKKIVEASYKLGRPLDTEGFIGAWLNGIKVIAETDNDGNYVGIAFAAIGDRWLYVDKAISILYHNVQDMDGFITFLRSIGQAFDAQRIIYESKLIEKTDKHEKWEITEEFLNGRV